MTFKRFIAVALSLLLLLGALPEMLPAALATPSTDGCTKSSDGKHAWYPRPRDPWCEISGGLVYICSYCNKQVFEETTPALGHDWGAWKTITEASCTKEGLKARSCNRCGKRETQTVPAAHDWGKWETDIPGTCIAQERLVRKCKKCGALDYWTKDYGDHDWGEWETVKAPTATEPGEEKRVCKNTPNHVETREIPATGGEPVKPEDEKPELTITLWAEDLGAAKKTEFQYEKSVYFRGSVTNTGNVDIELYNNEKKLSGYYSNPTLETRYLLKPGETLSDGDGLWFLSLGISASSIHINPGTETETLAGTITYTATVPGYRPGTDEVICSDTAFCTVSVLKPEDDPQLTLTASWADDAGEGKRYEGAEVEFVITQTNTGDCPLVDMSYENSQIISFIGPSGPIAPGVTYYLQPDESTVQVVRANVRPGDVDSGIYEYTWQTLGHYTNYDAYEEDVYSNAVKISIPLTYPDGEEPEEAKPGLKLTYKYDTIRYNGESKWSYTDKAGVIAPDGAAFADANLTNTGNVPLQAVAYMSWGNGRTDNRLQYPKLLAPGETYTQAGGYGSDPITYFMTPGTETEELLGTTTVNYYYVGYAAETFSWSNPGPELCRSETVTRTWQIGKNVEPEDPGDSNLSGKLEVRPGYEPSDPAGYQLGEPVSTILTVENIGPIDLETFTVSDPWDDTTFSDGPIAVSGTKSYIRADTTVTEDDVERGYIEFPMITIKWTDPDTKKERTDFAGPLTVPVLKKTGLLLKKGYEDPKNGEYFAEGEQIAWTLSVTNNAKESITDVKVDDQGVTVGEYAELKPNDKENCTVPKHTVTEYEAKVVGYVLNSATATGTDYRGATKTWPSNVAKAITKKPTEPGEDPKGEINGLHPAVSIVKAEDPAGPKNGSYYEANEPIKYTITIKNTGDTELKDIAVTDSLAGFTPIGTLASLAPNEEKTFDFSYTVKEEDIPYQWIYNSATVTYTFGENVKGTPRTSNTVQSRVGDEPFPPELPHLDPDKLPKGNDWCRLTLDRLGETEADYTLHACAEHAEAAMAAEEAAANGDWKAAAAIWEAEVEELYEILYNAADSQLKGAIIEERAVFYDYLDSFDPLTVDETVRSMRANVDSLYDMLLAAADETKKAELLAEKEKLYADIDASYGGSEGQARANTLRLKCAFLCCAMHTVPNELPSSLAGDYAQMMGGMEADDTARVFGALDGTDSEVTETYAGAALKAQSDVIDLLSSAKSYNADDVFARGQQLWTSALDNEVNPVYEAADKEQRKLIATWRISLDTLYAAEKDFLALLYEGNDETQEELLMELYKDAAIMAGVIK